MNVIGYIRVSTLVQAREGHSLDAQRQRIADHVKCLGHALIGIEADEGVSAKTVSGRPGFLRALAALETGRAEALVVCKLDRATRSLADLSMLIERYFQKYSLISLQEQIDTTSAAGRLILNILVTVSQWEREMAGERTREVFESLRARGIPAGPTPLGYTRSTGALAPSATEKATIARMVELRESGTSLRDIATMLQLDGYKPKRGDKWSHSSIRKVLGRQCG